MDVPTLREKSTWTPYCNKPVSDKLFQERLNLLKKWYAVWSKEQRWELVQFILLRLSDDDLCFIYSLLDPLMPRPPPPEVREDFTRLFPRHISLKIFSYLDARSLCRTAQVSWYWRYLTEQNMLWKPKCLRYGWFLPTPPTQYNPLTIWKRHYVNCVSNMYWKLPQVMSPSPPPSPPLTPPPIVSQSSVRSTTKMRKKKRKHSRGHSAPQLEVKAQQIWRHPNKYPSDLKHSDLFHSSINSYNTQSLKKSTSTKIEPVTKSTSTVLRHHQKTFTETVQSSNLLPLSSRPTVAIDAVIQPSLMEKLRLGDPTTDVITCSTISYPEREHKRTLAATVSRVQSNSPFPSLPSYYQEKEASGSEEVLVGERRREEKGLGEGGGGGEGGGEGGGRGGGSEDDLVRPWRDDDFISDSDSELT